MRVKVPKSVAKEIKKYTDSKIPVLGVIHFFPSEKKVGATTLEKALIVSVEIEGEGKNFNLPEKAMELFEREEELNVQVGKRVGLKGQKTKISFSQVEETVEFPLTAPEGEKVEGLREAVNKLKGFRKRGDFELDSYFIEGENGKLNIYATDRHSLGKFSTSYDGEKIRVIVGGDLKDIVESIKKIGDEEIKVAVKDNKFFVIGEKGFGYVALKELPFPPFDKIFKRDFQEVFEVSVSDLKDAVETAMLIFQGDEVKRARIVGRDGKIVITAENEKGEVEADLNGTIKKEFSFAIDLSLLDRVLGAVDEEKISVFLDKEKSAIKIYENENSEYFCALLKDTEGTEEVREGEENGDKNV